MGLSFPARSVRSALVSESLTEEVDWDAGTNADAVAMEARNAAMIFILWFGVVYK